MRLPDDEARSSSNIAQRVQEEDEINQRELGRGERCDAIEKGVKTGNSKEPYSTLNYLTKTN